MPCPRPLAALCLAVTHWASGPRLHGLALPPSLSPRALPWHAMRGCSFPVGTVLGDGNAAGPEPQPCPRGVSCVTVKPKLVIKQRGLGWAGLGGRVVIGERRPRAGNPALEGGTAGSRLQRGGPSGCGARAAGGRREAGEQLGGRSRPDGAAPPDLGAGRGCRRDLLPSHTHLHLLPNPVSCSFLDCLAYFF